MEKRSKIILLTLTGIIALIGLTTVAYAQTMHASGAGQCGSMTGTGGMGMMGGYGGMMGGWSGMQANCQSMMGQNGMSQCWNTGCQNMAQCQEIMRQQKITQCCC